MAELLTRANTENQLLLARPAYSNGKIEQLGFALPPITNWIRHLMQLYFDRVKIKD